MLIAKIDNEQIQLKLDGELKNTIMDLCNLIILFCEETENRTKIPSDKVYQSLTLMCDSYFDDTDKIREREKER